MSESELLLPLRPFHETLSMMTDPLRIFQWKSLEPSPTPRLIIRDSSSGKFVSLNRTTQFPSSLSPTFALPLVLSCCPPLGSSVAVGIADDVVCKGRNGSSMLLSIPSPFVRGLPSWRPKSRRHSMLKSIFPSKKCLGFDKGVGRCPFDRLVTVATSCSCLSSQPYAFPSRYLPDDG